MKVDLKHIVVGDMKWNDLAQNWVHWLVLVNAAMNDGECPE